MSLFSFQLAPYLGPGAELNKNLSNSYLSGKIDLISKDQRIRFSNSSFFLNCLHHEVRYGSFDLGREFVEIFVNKSCFSSHET